MVELGKRKRPKVVPGDTVKKETGCGKLYVTVTHLEGEEAPFEVFTHLGKAGGCSMAQTEGLCRSISMGLRYGIPVQEFIKQLGGIGCPNNFWVEGKLVRSCPDAISQVLKELYPSEEQNNAT